MNKLKVMHSNGDLEDFKPRLISETIKNETNVDDDLADKIQSRITQKIYSLKKNGLNEISTAALRAEVSSQLLKEKEFKAEETNRKLGMSVIEFEELLKNGCKDNANIGYSPEMIAKYSYDSIAKEYALLTMPEHCAEAHKMGYVHHHDLEFFNTRPNCFNADLRFFAKNGLAIDGKGEMGSVAKPAKSLEVLLNHLLQAWMAGSTVFSGGQGYVNFNTLLAPFAKGRTYEDIKQAIQGFVFNCNMSLVCRGGQVLFSSIGVDLSIPDVLANEPAIGPGGVPIGIYKDYQKEADLIFRAICEVINEKDGAGAPHRFPNVLYNIRDGDLDTYEGNAKLLHELGADNPSIYYVNASNGERTVMGCRTALPMNYNEDYELDCMNTGNFMYSTINLPLLALESESEEEFYQSLNKYCEIIYDTLIFRRQEVEKVLYDYHMSDFLLQKDKETGKQLYELDRTTMTIGYCGLNECLLQLYDKDIIQVQEKGIDIIKFLNKKKQEFFERDGLRWSVIASPAESTSHRFAKINKKKHQNAIVQGKKDNYYLTNSHHIPVESKTNLIEHIKNANKFHELSTGGCILHIWLGEVWSDPKALWKLNKKIIESNITFWAYSKVFTVCNSCGYSINDKLDECLICGSKKVTTYDRVTGYYLPTKTWNNGKKQEFYDRFRHRYIN